MKTRKKALIWTISVLGFMFLIAIVLVFVIPGWSFRTFLADTYPALEETIPTWTLPAPTPDRTTQTLTFYEFTLEVDADYHYERDMTDAVLYRAQTNGKQRSLIIHSALDDRSDLDIMEDLDNQYHADRYDREDVLDIMESFGYGRPDNAYNTERLIYNINWDDCPTFGFRKTMLFASLAVTKQVIFDTNYSFFMLETDTVTGIVTQLGGSKSDLAGYAVSLFPKSDPNREWILICRVEDEAEFQDILSSFTLL